MRPEIKSRLIEECESLFRHNVPYREPLSTHDCPECNEINEFFVGKSPVEIELSEMWKFRPAIALIEDEALKHFIYPFTVSFLKLYPHPERFIEELPEFLIYHFDSPRLKKYRHLYSEQEFEFLIKYFEYANSVIDPDFDSFTEEIQKIKTRWYGNPPQNA